MVEIKNFLYLDTSHIASVLSQINGGKIMFIQDETGESHGAEHESVDGNDSQSYSGELSIPSIVKATFKNKSSDPTYRENFTDIGSIKQIITKTLDDNMFDLFHNAISNEKLITESLECNKYTYITGDLNYFNIEYLQQLASKDMSKAINALSALQADPQINKGSAKSVYSNQAKDPFVNVRPILDMLGVLFPSNICAKVGDALMPIEGDYLRKTSSEVTLRNRTKVTVLAQAIKKYTPVNGEGIEMLKRAFEFMMPQIAPALGITFGNGDYYATPIAIFYS